MSELVTSNEGSWNVFCLEPSTKSVNSILYQCMYVRIVFNAWPSYPAWMAVEVPNGDTGRALDKPLKFRLGGIAYHRPHLFSLGDHWLSLMMVFCASKEQSLLSSVDMLEWSCKIWLVESSCINHAAVYTSRYQSRALDIVTSQHSSEDESVSEKRWQICAGRMV